MTKTFSRISRIFGRDTMDEVPNRRLHLTVLLAGISAFLVLAIILPGHPAQAALAQRSGTPTLNAWNPGFQNYGSVGSDTPTTAAQDANNFDLIIDNPFKNYSNGKKYDKATIDSMKQQNPNLKVLFYLSGCCDQVGKDVSNYPESAYAHNAAGNRLNSPAGVPLMNRRDSTWVTTRATHCQQWVQQFDIDGCFYDSSGFGWFDHGSPIDPKTNKPWTQTDYEAAGKTMFDGVKQTLGANGLVAVNGLGSGSSYNKNTGLLVGSVDMAMAEDWMQSPSDPVTSYDTGAAWLSDLQAAADMASRGKWFIPTIKSWTSGTQAQKDTLNKYAMATLLLGGDAHSYLAFEDEHGTYGGSQYYSFWNADVGSPNGTYFTSGGCYVRKFSNGFAVVNSGAGSCSYPLGGSYTNLAGSKVTTATLAAATGDVFTGTCVTNCGPVDNRPAITINTPANNASVAAGASVSITGTASDDIGVSSIKVSVDGTTINTFTGTTTFNTTWTAPTGTGAHTITATATDTSGQTTSDVATVNVGSAPCTAPATDYGTVSVTVNAQAAGVYRVWTRMAAPDATNNTYLLEVDGNTCYTVGGSSVPVYSGSTNHFVNNTSNWISKTTSGTTILPTLSVGSHTFKLIGNADGVELDRIVATQDTACVPTGTGNNCSNPADTTAPVVSITAPASGVTLSNTTTVTANATDNVAVAKVEFYIDNILKSTDISPDANNNFTYVLDPTTLTNGAHSLTAKAYDTAPTPNVTTSTAVSISVGSQTSYDIADINMDGKVDYLDLSILSSKYGQTGPNIGRADINQDGKVDYLDLSILSSHFGR